MCMLGSPVSPSTGHFFALQTPKPQILNPEPTQSVSLSIASPVSSSWLPSACRAHTKVKAVPHFCACACVHAQDCVHAHNLCADEMWVFVRELVAQAAETLMGLAFRGWGLGF